MVTPFRFALLLSIVTCSFVVTSLPASADVDGMFCRFGNDIRTGIGDGPDVEALDVINPSASGGPPMACILCQELYNFGSVRIVYGDSSSTCPDNYTLVDLGAASYIKGSGVTWNRVLGLYPFIEYEMEVSVGGMFCRFGNDIRTGLGDGPDLRLYDVVNPGQSGSPMACVRCGGITLYGLNACPPWLDPEIDADLGAATLIREPQPGMSVPVFSALATAVLAGGLAVSGLRESGEVATEPRSVRAVTKAPAQPKKNQVNPKPAPPRCTTPFTTVAGSGPDNVLTSDSRKSPSRATAGTDRSPKILTCRRGDQQTYIEASANRLPDAPVVRPQKGNMPDNKSYAA